MTDVKRPSVTPEPEIGTPKNVCEVCGGKAAIGFGSKPRWLCTEHFYQAFGSAMQTIREAIRGSSDD